LAYATYVIQEIRIDNTKHPYKHPWHIFEVIFFFFAWPGNDCCKPFQDLLTQNLVVTSRTGGVNNHGVATKNDIMELRSTGLMERSQE